MLPAVLRLQGGGPKEKKGKGKDKGKKGKGKEKGDGKAPLGEGEEVRRSQPGLAARSCCVRRCANQTEPSRQE